MDDEELKLTPWEEFKEYVRRKFGIGKYGTSRSMGKLLKLEDRVTGISIVQAKEKYRNAEMKENILEIKSQLQKEYEEFENAKNSGYFFQSAEKMNEAEIFLKKHNEKLDELDLLADDLVYSYGKINYYQELIDEKEEEIKKEKRLRSYRTEKEKVEEAYKEFKNSCNNPSPRYKNMNMREM